MTDSFISYARSTAREAQAVAEALRALGYGVWRDDELPAHRAYAEVIEERLQSAKAVVVIWSAEAVKSQWVQSEADRAREDNKLVQLTVDGIRLPMPFDRIQCADLSGWTGDLDAPGWHKVVASVGELAGTASAPTPEIVRAASHDGMMAVLAVEIEGIGLLRLNHRAALEEALAICTAAFRTNTEALGGTVFREADVMMAAFASPEAAVEAAVQAQRGLAGRVWPGLGVLKVRMAVHFGAAEPGGQDYFGPALNQVTPLLNLAQGEQILVTGPVAEPLSGRDGLSFKPVGAHALEDPLTKVSLFQVAAEGLKADFAPIAAEEALQVGNLPRRQGSLIGREADMAQIGALFEGADLVTVTGTGGVGKTRIAVEYAHLRQGHHEDGVWLVELAPLSDPEQVTAAIARAIGVVLPPGDQVQGLVDRLRPRDCLIVLDNCEHVIDAVAAVAEAVLEQATNVKLLASSQELIGVEGERVFRLRSLGEVDAATLFTERAKAADAGFAVKGRDAAAVAAICQRLDGIPLAIEMAAARAPSLGCEGVLQRLNDRFRILTGGRRTALPRQRTLAATLDWSHGLLSAEDAAVFRRLGVFTGGFTLEAASRVAGDESLDAVEVIDALSSLVAKSLVVAETEDNRTRYRLLETTRMYALERLAEARETDDLQRRHAEHFAAFAEGAAPDYYSLTDDAFHARYAADMENVERAMDWAFGPAGDVELGLRLTGQSWPAWVAFSKHSDYMLWSDLALSRITPQTPSSLALLVRQTALSVDANIRLPGVQPLADLILADIRAVNDPHYLAETLVWYLMSLRLRGHIDEATVVNAELAALLANLPTTRLTLFCQMQDAWLVADRGDLAELRGN